MSKYKIEHYDDFDDVIVIWIEMSPPKDKLIVNKMKQLDKENYNKQCYGCCVHYNLENNEFCIATEFDSVAYYIDNNGVKHWFNVELDTDTIFEYCKNEIVNQLNNFKE